MSGSQLHMLRDVNPRRAPEYLNLSDGNVYADDQGLKFLRKIYENEFVETGNESGTSAVKLRNEDGTPIHKAQLSDGAAIHYAEKRVLSTGRRERVNGRLIQMDLAPSDVHTNAAIPTYAAGYRIADGMADVASPVILSDKQSNVYYTWNQNTDFQRKIPVAGAPGAGYGEVNPSLSPSTYTTVQYTLGGFMPTEVVANADTPLRPFVKLTQVVIDALRLEREYRVATQLQTSANWNSGNVFTVLAGAQWNGGGASDPIFNLHKAIEASYLPVTGILWSELVEHDFVRNPNVQKFFTYKDTVDGIPDPQKISSTLRLPPIYTAMMKYVTGAALTYVWGNHVVLLHNTGDLTSQMDVATARTFRWNGAEGATPDGTLSAGFLVRTFFDPKRGARGGTQVVVVHSDTEVQTSGYVGSLILNAHQ